MKIIENSTRRLELRLARHGVSAGLCVLDRDSGEAAITRFALGIPYLWKRLPLSQITGVIVRRGTQRRAYHPMLELTFGDALSIGGYTKDDALEAARAIKD